MDLQIRKQWKTGVSLFLKCGAILLLLFVSILIVACGSTTGTNITNINGPVTTVTIHIGDTKTGSPTPPLPTYWCGAWATQSSPAINASAMVGVYAKFTHNINGNPEGVEGATATAIVMWPDGTTTPQTVTTTADGLAVFAISVANRADAVNRLTLVTVTFTKGDQTCTVGEDRAAFFTLIVVSPTATSTPGTTNGTPQPGGTTTPGQLPTRGICIKGLPGCP